MEGTLEKGGRKRRLFGAAVHFPTAFPPALGHYGGCGAQQYAALQTQALGCIATYDTYDAYDYARSAGISGV
jgi:hypothetical protein